MFLVQFHLNQQRWIGMLFMAQLLGSSHLRSLLVLLPGITANVSKFNYYRYIHMVNALIRDASNRDLWFVDDWQSEIHLKNRMETEKGKGKKKPKGVGELATW